MLCWSVLRSACRAYAALEYVDFCAGRDAAAVDGIDLEGCAEVHGGGGIRGGPERVDSGVDESAEEHVAGDASEAVEIGNAHVGF
jgi:hypothetical protein